MRVIALCGLALVFAAAALSARAEPGPSPAANRWGGSGPTDGGNRVAPVAPAGPADLSAPSKAEVDLRMVMSPEALLQRVKQRMAAVFAAYNQHRHTYVRLDLQTWRVEPQEFIALTRNADLQQSIRLYKPEHDVGEPLRTGSITSPTTLPMAGAMFDPFDRSLAQLPLAQQVVRLTQMWRHFKTEVYARHQHGVTGTIPDRVDWRPSIKEQPTRLLYVASPDAERPGGKLTGPPGP